MAVKKYLVKKYFILLSGFSSTFVSDDLFKLVELFTVSSQLLLSLICFLKLLKFLIREFAGSCAMICRLLKIMVICENAR